MTLRELSCSVRTGPRTITEEGVDPLLSLRFCQRHWGNSKGGTTDDVESTRGQTGDVRVMGHPKRRRNDQSFTVPLDPFEPSVLTIFSWLTSRQASSTRLSFLGESLGPYSRSWVSASLKLDFLSWLSGRWNPNRERDFLGAVSRNNCKHSDGAIRVTKVLVKGD